MVARLPPSDSPVHGPPLRRRALRSRWRPATTSQFARQSSSSRTWAQRLFELVPQHGLANSFIAKVDAATRTVVEGRYGPATDQLDALQHEMDAAADRLEATIANVLKNKRDSANAATKTLSRRPDRFRTACGSSIGRTTFSWRAGTYARSWSPLDSSRSTARDTSVMSSSTAPTSADARRDHSKTYRDRYGHTPLSVEEEIPWGRPRLIIGTGADGQLPIMPEVQQEADRRGITITACPTREACRLISHSTDKVAAILHVTC